jgi:eukaryotic-like serine/threonine-protein kinase
MESPTQKPHCYRFGLFEVNVVTGVLLRQGQRVKVQELPLRLLLALIEHPGEIVSRETLRERLWAENTFVEFDQSLGTALTKLRQALGDDAENPRFVETVPKRGYRFIAPVIIEPAASTTAPTSAESPALVTTPVTATEASPASASSDKSIVGRLAALVLVAAVLLAAAAYLWASRGGGHIAPKLGEKDTVVLADFINHTGDPAFDETLKRALAISLAQSPVLNIFPDHQVEQTLRTMERPPGQPVTDKIALEVCQRSGSKALVAGTISALGSKYVVALDAIDCQSGAVFGQELREAKRKEDVLEALGEAGTSVRRRLGESLASIRRFDVPLQQATTSSLDALKAFSTAWNVRDELGDTAALPYVKRAIELDPNFAMAYGLLAQMYQVMGEDGLGAANAQRAYELRDRVTEREYFSLTNFYLNFVVVPASRPCRTAAFGPPPIRKTAPRASASSLTPKCSGNMTRRCLTDSIASTWTPKPPFATAI